MDCKYFDGCSAPMCPKDAGVGNTAWFPGEEICCLKDVPEWVKRQRKITKTGADETAGCFTLPMLEHRCVIGKNIAGLDPNGTESEMKAAEKNWIGKHPVRKPLTEERQEKVRAQMASVNAKRTVKSERKIG